MGFGTLDKVKKPAAPAVTTRRFPPPWSVEDIGVAFVVKDRVGPAARALFTSEAERCKFVQWITSAAGIAAPKIAKYQSINRFRDSSGEWSTCVFSWP